MAKKTYTNREGQRRHLTRWQKEVAKHGVRGAKKHYSGYKQRPAPPTTTGNVRSTKSGTRRVNNNRVGPGRRSILYYKGDKVGTWTKSGGNKSRGRTGLSWYMERGYGTAKKPVPETPLTKRLGIAGKGKAVAAAEGMLVPGAVDGLNTQEDWEMQRAKRKEIREAEDLERTFTLDLTMDAKDEEDFANAVLDLKPRELMEHIVEVKDAEFENMDAEEMLGSIGEGNDFGQMGAEEVYDAELTMWQRAVKKHGVPPAKRSKARGHGAFKEYRGRRQKDGVMYHHGDKVSTYDKNKGYSTKGTNKGRSWYMERGFGTARKPVPSTELTRKLGIAGAGRQLRDKRGRFGRMKRMLVPAQGTVGFGLNSKQDWEMGKSTRGQAIREDAGLLQGEIPKVIREIPEKVAEIPKAVLKPVRVLIPESKPQMKTPNRKGRGLRTLGTVAIAGAAILVGRRYLTE